jgi:dTDP-4-dehydrorhamnose 3,5-epimerase
MNIIGNLLDGVKITNRIIHTDERGGFSEYWKIQHDGMRGSFRQLNTATSKQFVIRGLHRQNQYKLVMPIVGKIFDVVLEPETGKWCAIELDESVSLLIPPKYAHGYMTLSEKTVVQYIVDMPYNKEEEENFKWYDYSINWPLQISPMLSQKDS